MNYILTILSEFLKGGIRMIYKIVVIALCAAAIALTFKSEWILKNIFKKSEPSEKAVMTVKLAALALAVILFLAVFRVRG